MQLFGDFLELNRTDILFNQFHHSLHLVPPGEMELILLSMNWKQIHVIFSTYLLGSHHAAQATLLLYPLLQKCYTILKIFYIIFIYCKQYLDEVPLKEFKIGEVWKFPQNNMKNSLDLKAPIEASVWWETYGESARMKHVKTI